MRIRVKTAIVTCIIACICSSALTGLYLHTQFSTLQNTVKAAQGESADRDDLIHSMQLEQHRLEQEIQNLRAARTNKAETSKISITTPDITEYKNVMHLPNTKLARYDTDVIQTVQEGTLVLAGPVTYLISTEMRVIPSLNEVPLQLVFTEGKQYLLAFSSNPNLVYIDYFQRFQNSRCYKVNGSLYDVQTQLNASANLIYTVSIPANAQVTESGSTTQIKIASDEAWVSYAPAGRLVTETILKAIVQIDPDPSIQIQTIATWMQRFCYYTESQGSTGRDLFSYTVFTNSGCFTISSYMAESAYAIAYSLTEEYE